MLKYIKRVTFLKLFNDSLKEQILCLVMILETNMFDSDISVTIFLEKSIQLYASINPFNIQSM